MCECCGSFTAYPLLTGEVCFVLKEWLCIEERLREARGGAEGGVWAFDSSSSSCSYSLSSIETVFFLLESTIASNDAVLHR
jgi:hypothetical protein